MGWKQRLADAMKAGHFTEDDRVDAGSWDRCAVGEFRKAFDVFAVDRESLILHTLGMDFCHEVESGDVKAATKTYEKIVETVK